MARVRRSAAAGVAVLLAAGLAAAGLAAGLSQVASAQPQPTVSQVQARVNTLTAKFNKAVEQYDVVAQQLTQAKGRLKQVDAEMAADQVHFTVARIKVVQIANASFENSGQTSLAGLLTSGDPAAVLNAASMLTQLTGSRNMQTEQFLTAAQQLSSVQQEQQRTEYGISQLASQRANTKKSIQTTLDNEKAELDSLTTQQQEQVQANSLGGGNTVSTSVPAGTPAQAATAVQFALDVASEHCPYLFGGTGPCSVGYDCSGLVQAAWAAAGVNIPRDTYEQWASLPHISMSSLQPGDLIYYDGEGHVAMYVGNGDIVDAPQTGEDVEEIPMSTAWYAANTDGAVRP